MAGNWIKMGVDLRTHPKVVRIAAGLKSDRLRVLGALYAAWCIFDAHAAGGVLEGYTPEALDDELGWKGFSRAMAAVGWLEIIEEGLHAPRFEEHNGTTAKRRAVETSRKRSSREAHDPRTKTERMSAWKADKCPQGDGTEPGQVYAPDADKMRAREEKRREEEPKPKTETTPATSRDSQAGSGQPPAGAAPPELPPHPDPRVVATVEALRVGAAAGTDLHERAGELFAALKANGCKGTPQHPQVLEWARNGITIGTLRRAIGEARKANDGPLNPAYLAPIVERVLAGGDKPANGKAQAWATDDGACEVKARELGLWPAKPGETYHDLRGRIRAKIAKAAEESVR